VTTLDELIVAGVEQGLRERELLRLVLGHMDGESATQTLVRIFPLNEQLMIGLGEREGTATT
jgi:hypothetical protein